MAGTAPRMRQECAVHTEEVGPGLPHSLTSQVITRRKSRVTHSLKIGCLCCLSSEVLSTQPSARGGSGLEDTWDQEGTGVKRGAWESCQILVWVGGGG